MSTTITINGKTISIDGGGSICVLNNRIYVNGKEVAASAKVDQVVITGNCGDVKADCSVTVHGAVLGDVHAGGCVNCNDVRGDVNAGGSVNCDDVGGDVSARGNVNCG